jgi:benzoyl-CoA-dihydrodiol lyase
LNRALVPVPNTFKAPASPTALGRTKIQFCHADRRPKTRVFGRLTAWQNWIFQRPNAVGEKGALKVYGTGQKAGFDLTRV